MQYVTFNKLENGDLELRLLPEAKEDLQDTMDREDWGWWQKELEVVEYQTCNGWDWLRPEHVGLVSDGCPAFTDDAEFDEMMDDLLAVSHIWVYTDYAIRSFLKPLLEDGSVVFTQVMDEPYQKPKTLPEYRMENGKLQSYAWPGGYPLYYLDDQNNTLCPDCANEEDQYTSPVAAGVNWEDPDLYCDQCSERIESAYAEDDEEDEE